MIVKFGALLIFEQRAIYRYSVTMIKSTTRKARKAPAPGSLEAIFSDRLDMIEEHAKAAGANMTIVCKLANISRAGPVRWRRDVPLTIKLIDRMSGVVEKLTQKKAAKGK
jgi:hypothetical protein